MSDTVKMRWPDSAVVAFSNVKKKKERRKRKKSALRQFANCLGFFLLVPSPVR